MKLPNYYGILTVGRHADTETIKRAYRLLAKRYHPDRHPDDPEANDRIRVINEAYRVLSDPELRAKYDEMLFQKAHEAATANNWHRGRSAEDLAATDVGSTSRFNQERSRYEQQSQSHQQSRPPEPEPAQTYRPPEPEPEPAYSDPYSTGQASSSGQAQQPGNRQTQTWYVFQGVTHEDVLGPVDLMQGMYIVEFQYQKSPDLKADIYLEFQDVKSEQEIMTIYGSGVVGRDYIFGKKTLRVSSEGTYLIQMGFIWHPECVSEWQVRILKP